MLPGEQFTTFRAACKRTLSAPAFARLDARLHDAAAWWQAQFDATDFPTSQWFASRLQERFDATARVNDFVTDVRAGQVVAFHRGLFARVDEERLMYAVLTTPR